MKPAAMKAPKKSSALEEQFALHCRVSNLPEHEREFRFAPPRKWRADFAFVAQKLLVEIEGGIWTGGRHTRGSGFEKDVEKYNAATVLGFRVLRFTGSMVKSGVAIETVIAALKGE
jgi:very-short-patch-repair endonuclease